jgi:hypothetical protein
MRTCTTRKVFLHRRFVQIGGSKESRKDKL